MMIEENFNRFFKKGFSQRLWLLYKLWISAPDGRLRGAGINHEGLGGVIRLPASTAEGHL